MTTSILRSACCVAAVALSAHVAAAEHTWTLTGVQFDESGTYATGYFTYDDATQTISSWNVHVNDPFAVSYPAFTYVPGNSVASTSAGQAAGSRTLVFSAVMGTPGAFPGERHLQIAPPAALDGGRASVALDSASREDFGPGDRGRFVIAGALTLTTPPPTRVVVEVVEFYNATLGHYFITASDTEKQALDTGVHAGWMRTGQSFKAFAPGSSAGAPNPVCRFYSDPQNPDAGGVDSHFLSADAGECLAVFRRWASGFWEFESDDVFEIDLADKATGACPAGTVAVYRLWNQRIDSNHRYTTSIAIRADMLRAGYLPEGYGADGVAMCALL